MESLCNVCGNWNTTRDPKTETGSSNLETISLLSDVIGFNDDSRFSSRYNTSPEIIEADPSFPDIVFDSKAGKYNMKGMKILYILCHSSYNNFEKLNFRCPPSREGARRDADLMTQAFARFGFRFKIYYDLTYQQIIDRLSKVSQQDHAKTSLMWVAVMTHSMGKELFAADRLYKLSDIAGLLTSANLVGIPKILTLPCLRGGNELPQYLRHLLQPPQNESLPCNAIVDLWRSCFRSVQQCMEPNETCKKCAEHNTDDGITGTCASEGTFVHPTSSHLQYIYAANYDLVSMGILIRAICEVFDEHEEMDFLEDLIQGITRKVDKYTDPAAESTIPEYSTYLTATIRFTCTVSQQNSI